jgi:NAD(P)-dependent dehydrogenase (short-subunit alcohol dehydrogenase family)
MKLAYKVVIITGGAKGIGLGCAKAFAQLGCAVVLGDRDAAGGPASAAQLTQTGATAPLVHCDVTGEADLAALVAATVERSGRLDYLVIHAGWHPPAMTIKQTSVEDFGRLPRLNLTSTLLACKLAAPHVCQTRGSISDQRRLETESSCTANSDPAFVFAEASRHDTVPASGSHSRSRLRPPPQQTASQPDWRLLQRARPLRPTCEDMPRPASTILLTGDHALGTSSRARRPAAEETPSRKLQAPEKSQLQKLWN